jgi:hypothetical protein
MNTRRNRIATPLAWLALLVGVAVASGNLAAQTPPAKYTAAERAMYMTASAEKDPQAKIKQLDAFVAQYPTSALLNYAYNDYWQAYAALHQYGKVIDYLDKLLALQDIDAATRLEAQYRRAATFEYAFNANSLDLAAGSTKARDAALEGMKILSAFQKPAQATDEQWAGIKKQYSVQFTNTAASASYYLKDYKAAAQYYHDALVLDPTQAVDDYRMGLSDLRETPPQSIAGFWALARAVDLKVPDADKVTKFLHDKINEYQQPGCEASVDPQIKDLLALAQNSVDPPATFSIPSAADLAKKRESANIQTVLADLKAGGDNGKLTWLAVCSGEFPEALAKAYEVNAAATDAITMKAAVGTTEEELNASTAPNSDLKLGAQPEAARLEKDSIFRFSGKLTGYTADPFNLKWENVKVNPEDIPEEKGKKPAKRPGKKP